jgi:hypothetical protein
MRYALSTWLYHLQRPEMWLGLGVAWTVKCLLQGGDGSFTSPWDWPGQEGVVCSCCCVWSVTAIGGGCRVLPRVRCSAVPRSRMPIFVSVGLATLVTVR